MAAPSYVGQGVVQAVTTAAAIPYPTVQAGDLILLIVSSNATGIGTAPAGWTEVGALTTGGSITTRRWARIATGAESGTTTINVTSGTKGAGYTVAYRPAVDGGVLSVSLVNNGVDTTNASTAYSATGSSWTVPVDGRIVTASSVITTGTFSGIATGITLTQTGATFSKTDRFAARISSNTFYYGHQDASVTTGSTNAPTLAFTTPMTTGTGGTGQTQFLLITETPAPLIPRIVPSTVAQHRAATR